MSLPLTLEGCSTESDLAALAQGVLDDASSIRDSLLQQVASINTDKTQSLLDLLNKKYDQFISPTTPEELATQTGLLPPVPDTADLELRLEPFGLVMVKGIIYAAGTDGNIANFRKLFFAVGSNVTLFLNLIKSSDLYIVVQTHLTIKKLPQIYKGLPKNTWSISEVRSYFSNDAIEQVYLAADGKSYAIVPSFLSVNKSAQQTAFEENIPVEEIVTQVFWLNEVTINSSVVNKLTKLGLNKDEITSVLTESSVKSVNATGLESLRTLADQANGTALNQIKFLNSRFSASTPETISILRKEIQGSIKVFKNYLLSIERMVRFSPTLLVRTSDIDIFLSKNSQTDLSYLFSTRRSVTSINFQVPQNTLNSMILKALNVPSGSSTISGFLLNLNSETVDPDIDYTNQAWAQEDCGITHLSLLGELKWLDLNLSYQCLSSVVLRPPVTTKSTTPIPGYPGADSPGSIIFNNGNLNSSLGIYPIFDLINSLAAKQPSDVASAINALVAMLKGLLKAADSVIDPLIAKIRAINSQVEAFISRNSSFFTGSLHTSILNCVGLHLNAAMPFFADISGILQNLETEIHNLVGKIAKVISGVLNDLFCLPINFLNNILKSVTVGLAPICQVDTFKLPSDIQAALISLRDSFSVKNSVYSSFNRNLLKLDYSASYMYSKASNFQKDLLCNNSVKNDRFTDLFRAQVSVDLGNKVPNPLDTLRSGTNSLTPTRG